MKHLKSGLKKASHFAPVQALAHQAIERAGEYAAQHGIDHRLIEQASSMAHTQFTPPIEGGSFKSFTRGVKKFAQNPIVDKLGRMAINEATGGLAGMGFMGMGVKHKAPAKRGHKKKGAALYPAGMGFGGF